MPETLNSGTPPAGAENRPSGPTDGVIAVSGGDSVCWNCEKSLGDEDICPSCIRVQPFGPGKDYFEILDLPRSLNLDPRLLVGAYHEKSRAFHPDHHVEDTDREQDIALSNSSLVNLAFRTLRDPFSRAGYFIGRIKGEPAHLHKKATLSPAALMEIMDLREEILEQAREGRGEAAEQTLRKELDPLERAIFDSFPVVDRLLDEGGPASPALVGALSELDRQLEKHAYLANLLRDLRGGL